MESLNLGLGGVCDYRCIFCSRGNDHYFDRIGFNSLDEYEKAIKQLYLYSKEHRPDTLTISRDEPINHPFIGHVVRFARKVGFKKIVLNTAGMGLKDKKFLTGLVRSGVSSVLLPVYGVTPAVHDAVVGLPGAHAVLGRVAGMLRDMKVETNFTTVVLKQNLHEIEAIVERYGCNVTFPYPIGSRVGYKDLCVRLSEIPESIHHALNLFVPCITGKAAKKKEGGIVHLRTVPLNIPQASHNPFFKPAKCRRCGMYRECEGVFREYVAIYGSGEFKPIVRTPPRRRRTT